MTAVSRCFISSWVPSSVTVFIQPMLPVGAPALVAASAMISTERVMQRAAEGCGLMTIGQRALSAINTLYIAVDVGLVDGTTAATTPKGSAISMIFRSSMRFTTPTVFMGRMNAYTCFDENRFF